MKRKFRPKWSRDCNLLARVVTGVLPTPEGLLERQRMTELQAIEAFSKGYATPYDFRTLADMLNVAETMAKNGIGHEVLDACREVELLLLCCKDDWDAHQRMQISTFEVSRLRDLYEYHDLQRTAIDWQTYAKMIEKTANRIRSAHPDVKELV